MGLQLVNVVVVLPKLGLDLTQSSKVLHLSGVRFKIIDIIEALLVGGFKHCLFSIIYGTILPIDFYIFFGGVETTNQIMNYYFQLILQHNDFLNVLATCWNVCWTIFGEMCPRDMFFSTGKCAQETCFFQPGNVPKKHVFSTRKCAQETCFFQPGPSDSLIVQYVWSGGSYSQVAWKSPNPFSTEIVLLDPEQLIKIGATYRHGMPWAQALPDWAGGELFCLGALPWKYLGDITSWHRSGPPATRTRSVGAYITPMSRTGLWYANNELVTGAYNYKSTNITGGPHIVGNWW